MFDGNMGALRKLLARHGLDSRVLEDGYAPVSLQAYLGLFEEAAEILGDPNLGLRLGAKVRPGSFGPMGLRAAHCATILQGLESLARYSAALQGGTQVTLEQDAPHASLRYMITAPHQSPQRQDSEFTLAGICALIRRGYDLRWRPLEVHFSHPAPDPPAQIERWFEAPVLFSQPANMLLIDMQAATRVMREEDPDLLDLIDRHLAGLIEEAGRGQSLAHQVRALVMLMLGVKPVTLESVARQLQTSPRTLQRNLAAEGRSLKAIVQDYREERARLLLADGTTSIETIAATLGYADGTAFWRAYKGWTGQSPTAMKRRP
ncbi:AraC family transcriptional regulator [Thioclava sp. GXIMD2076]|uniref:AraC family transcriptional regulator n=1 Tax=Thioclava kandeliae TaxID=3070818 RepID=A0ABV1SE59_9RHOB